MISNAISGLKHLFAHEPLRLLYIAGLAASAAYEQLNGGLDLENVLFAVGALVLTELGRAVVTSPATANAAHVD